MSHIKNIKKKKDKLNNNNNNNIRCLFENCESLI